MRSSSAKYRATVPQIHPYAWLWESLEAESSFLLRPMFALKALYLDGKLMFCFAAKPEPWRGLLIATDRERHSSLLVDFPELVPHPILPKWLYLSESTGSFDSTAQELCSLVKNRDPRIGILPEIKKSRKNLKRKTDLM
jgi:hypothetical protein